ncbi:MAG: hypothetical protein LC114_02570, partial [Bryobacterales bacterium]|nr:hypothetical protein [Bryobacterales bacterium]
MSSSLNLEAAYNAVREAVLALPANDPTPNAQIKAAVEEILTQHITRALDAIDRNDSLEATQAIAQAMAVSSAWVAGTVWGWSAKLPIQGLALVFQSVRKTSPFGGQESMFARLLGEFGFSAVTRTKIANFTQGIAFGAAFAYGVNSFINVAKTFLSAATTPAADPLTLDLDGDGIETVGINSASPVMFDITGTGIQQSVGWVGADDGFLVRDLNGNGLIDSGAEL